MSAEYPITEARAQFGSLVRRASHDRERFQQIEEDSITVVVVLHIGRVP